MAGKNANCLILVQMDANAKVGKGTISHDPNEMSDNGRLLLELIERESLALLNISDLCTGTITRHRETKDTVEKSILDYILTCEKLAEFLESMFIDEQRISPLTKFASKKGVQNIVKSDHNIMYSKFSIEYDNVIWKKPRKEFFNLKNPECKSKFTEVTNNSRKLKSCFQEGNNFPDQCNRFFKSLDDILHQCFRKVRVGSQSTNKEIDELLKRQSELKTYLITNDCQTTRNKLNDIENEISNLTSARNISLVNEYIQNLENSDGNFSQIGMWKLKSKLMPREMDPPMGKFDEKGNLITAPNALKTLYLDHYVKRLQHRIIKGDYTENYDKKVALW